MMRLVLGVAAVSLATAGCGQKGALYLPPKNGTVVTRPAAGTAQDSGATTTAAPAAGAAQQQDKDKKDEGQPGQPPQ